LDARPNDPDMANDTRFKPGRSGSPANQFQAGNRFRWQPGQSGNPAGVARSRLEFEERFYASLMEQGSADEAAALLWKSARKREPWAVQALLQRLAPETKQIKLTHGPDDATDVDYEQLSEDELRELQRLHEKAAVRSEKSEEGTGKA
jgi:hypothetical protein